MLAYTQHGRNVEHFEFRKDGNAVALLQQPVKPYRFAIDQDQGAQQAVCRDFDHAGLPLEVEHLQDGRERNAVQIALANGAEMDLEHLATRLGQIGPVKQNAYLVRFGIDNHELTVFADGRAIVKGTDDVAKARSLYARYVGI